MTKQQAGDSPSAIRFTAGLDCELRCPRMALRSSRCLVGAVFLAAVGCGHDDRASSGPGWGSAALIAGGSDADRAVVGGMLPRLAMNASGSAFAVWERHTASASVWVSRYDPIQGWSAAEFMGDGGEPVVVIDAGGNALLAWLEEEGQRRSLRWRRFVAGSGWSAAARVPVASDVADAFSLAVAPTGDALLVWTASTGVWASSSSVGGGWGVPVLIGRQGAIGHVSAPQVAMSDGGDAAAVWIDHQAMAPFGSVSLRGTHLVAGSGWQNAQTIGQAVRDLVPTRLEADPAGNALVAWTPVSVVAGIPLFSQLSKAGGWQRAQRVDSLGQSVVKQLALGGAGDAVLILSPPLGVAHDLGFPWHVHRTRT